MVSPSARGALFGEGARGGEGRCLTTDSPPSVVDGPVGRAEGGGGGKTKFYVDVHRLANKDRKKKTDENYHIYTDGINFGKTTRVADIPAKAGDELYVDIIPVELTDEFVEVLRRGVKVLYLRRMTVLAKKREELGLSKTSRNDIKAMMALDPKWFREVGEDFLVMRRLICVHRSLLKTYVSLTNRMRALQETERRILMRLVKATQEAMNEMAAKIVDEAGRRIPAYDAVVRALGIEGENHLYSREALAEIMVYVERTTSFKHLKKFFGIYKGSKYHHRAARAALSRLTAAIIKNTHHRARDEEQILKRIWKTVKETRERLEAPA
ncbi:MAG: hypothetical protein QXM16_08205 [Nitrososphaerota archaeon]